ncbi:phosphate ABC transporter, permease protein PstA [bacterium Unc6]|nr:phosphate ABC transporter, permease protein PstA [bacterium Unc6]MBT9130709.1 Phosphate transport system permease protein PstA 1 [Candidatus Psychracetigena formicireducens]
MRKFKELVFSVFLHTATALPLIALFSVIFFIISRGAMVINWEFLTQMPRDAMTAGGIFPAIVGTFYLVLVAVFFALPLGVMAAIYLVEYTRQGGIVQTIRIGVSTLAGVPSVVFGLFGMVIFVRFFGFGVSILSGGLTLGIMILPTVIRTSEEALLAIPQGFREASFALGATKWQTIYRIVMPNSISSILTGSILGIGRAAGDTASILFTAATFYIMHLPNSVFSEVQALPYHIYGLLTEGTHAQAQIPIAYGTATVLLFLVLSMSALSIVMRNRFRRRKKW